MKKRKRKRKGGKGGVGEEKIIRRGSVGPLLGQSQKKKRSRETEGKGNRK